MSGSAAYPAEAAPANRRSSPSGPTSPATPATPALSALRQATHHQHQAIEDLLQLGPVAGGAPLSLTRYAAVLRGFERFLSQWEPRVLAAAPPALQHWYKAHSRHGFVLQDLAVLGQPAPSAGPAVQPSPADPAGADPVVALHLPDLASALGSLYVVEGSALGGQVIARALQAQHGLGTSTGARYFTGHGADTGRLWRQFREQLGESLDADPAGTERACTAAVATFNAMIAVFRATPGAVTG